MTLPRYFRRDVDEQFTSDFAEHFASDFDIDLVGHFVGYFGRDVPRYFAHYFVRDFVRSFISDVAGNFSSGAGGLVRDFASSIEIEGKVALLSPVPLAPNASREDIEVREHDITLNLGRNHEEALAFAKALELRRMGEAYVAVLTAVGMAHPESRVLFAASRLQHRSILTLWPALDSLVNVHDPIHLATYLCLGWTQACTTWTWPGTPTWIELLGGAPPSHWWPRAQFHLTWLVHEPDSTVHQAALGAALEEGRLDPELPGVADALDRLLG